MRPEVSARVVTKLTKSWLSDQRAKHLLLQSMFGPCCGYKLLHSLSYIVDSTRCETITSTDLDAVILFIIV